MTSLGEVSTSSVQEAALKSGYSLPPKGDAPGQKLFIWACAPTTQGEVIPATWGNVLNNFGSWIMEEPCAVAP